MLEESHSLEESSLDAISGSLCELCVMKHDIAASDVDVGWIVRPLGNPVGRKPRMASWVLPYVPADSLLRWTPYTGWSNLIEYYIR
jgi:hypothetical protein